MGYSASSYAVFGKATTRTALTVKSKERGCNHNTDEKQKFCSECGKPTWVQKETFIAEEVRGSKVEFFAPTYECDDGVLGVRLLRTSDEDIDAIPAPTAQMAQDILNFYKEHGIACSEPELKTYMFTYHSY